MAVYTVHEPRSTAGIGAPPEPERFVFVRDGFSFWALLLGPLWMLRHRMWLVLLGYIVVVAALSLVVHAEGAQPGALAAAVRAAARGISRALGSPAAQRSTRQFLRRPARHGHQGGAALPGAASS